MCQFLRIRFGSSHFGSSHSGAFRHSPSSTTIAPSQVTMAAYSARSDIPQCANAPSGPSPRKDRVALLSDFDLALPAAAASPRAEDMVEPTGYARTAQAKDSDNDVNPATGNEEIDMEDYSHEELVNMVEALDMQTESAHHQTSELKQYMVSEDPCDSRPPEIAALWKHFLATLLTSMPLLSILTCAGFKLAQRKSQTVSAGFCIISPLLVASFCNVVILATTLVATHGWPELQGLLSRRYISTAWGSILGALKFLLQNVALSNMSACTFFVVMKASLVHVACLEAVVKRELPDRLKAMTLVGVMLYTALCLLHYIETMEDSPPMLPILAALGSAFADAVHNMVAKVCCARFDVSITNQRLQLGSSSLMSSSK